MSSLRVQKGSDPQSSVLAALAEASAGAVDGGALMAWASTRGLESLFGNTAFRDFIGSKPFRLIVGVDAVTDSAALDTLAELGGEYPALHAQVFVHDRPWLFHPKLAWFLLPDGSMNLVVGSGNLTSWGLRSNWEATFVTQLPPDQAASALRTVSDFVDENAPFLLDPDDTRAHERAARNSGSERSVRMSDAVPPSRKVGDPSVVTTWLIAEMRKSRKNSLGQSMFSQASFSREEFESFFGYVDGGMDLQLFQVTRDGNVGEIESRRGRYKPASVNYYFELGGARGLPYPSAGSPITVFCRLESGEFLYTLVLPHEPGWAELNAFLELAASGGGKRHATVTREDVEAVWPDCPILSAMEPVG